MQSKFASAVAAGSLASGRAAPSAQFGESRGGSWPVAKAELGGTVMDGGTSPFSRSSTGGQFAVFRARLQKPGAFAGCIGGVMRVCSCKICFKKHKMGPA